MPKEKNGSDTSRSNIAAPYPKAGIAPAAKKPKKAKIFFISE
jgi:hypothetical protein